VTESEAASKARVAELESALAGAGSETTQQLDTLQKELAASSSVRDQLQTQLSEMTEKEAKVRAQAKEAVEKLKEKLKSVTESEAASKARVAELENAVLQQSSGDSGSELESQIVQLRQQLQVVTSSEYELKAQISAFEAASTSESDATSRKVFLEEVSFLRSHNQQLEASVASLRSELASASGADKKYSQDEFSEALQKQKEKAFSLLSEKDRVIDDLKKKNAVLLGSSSGKGAPGPTSVSVSLPSTPTKAGSDSSQMQTLLDKIMQLQKRIVDMESSYKLQVDVLKTEVAELSREKKREGLNMGCVLPFCFGFVAHRVGLIVRSYLKNVVIKTLSTDSTSGNDEHDVRAFPFVLILFVTLFQRMAQVVCDLLELSEAEKQEAIYAQISCLYYQIDC